MMAGGPIDVYSRLRRTGAPSAGWQAREGFPTFRVQPASWRSRALPAESSHSRLNVGSSAGIQYTPKLVYNERNCLALEWTAFALLNISLLRQIAQTLNTAKCLPD